MVHWSLSHTLHDSAGSDLTPWLRDRGTQYFITDTVALATTPAMAMQVSRSDEPHMGLQSESSTMARMCIGV